MDKFSIGHGSLPPAVPLAELVSPSHPQTIATPEGDRYRRCLNVYLKPYSPKNIRAMTRHAEDNRAWPTRLKTFGGRIGNFQIARSGDFRIPEGLSARTIWDIFNTCVYVGGGGTDNSHNYERYWLSLGSGPERLVNEQLDELLRSTCEPALETVSDLLEKASSETEPHRIYIESRRLRSKDGDHRGYHDYMSIIRGYSMGTPGASAYPPIGNTGPVVLECGLELYFDDDIAVNEIKGIIGAL